MPFEDTTAIVTGGAQGLGLAIAEALAARGTKVAIFDLATDQITAEVDRLRGQGGTVNGYTVDVSDRSQVKAAVDRVRVDMGPVLILINNAGIEQFGKFTEITDEQWDRVMAINLRGPFICTQEVLSDMVDAHWGRIVNISSSSAQGGHPGWPRMSARRPGSSASPRVSRLSSGPRESL